MKAIATVQCVLRGRIGERFLGNVVGSDDPYRNALPETFRQPKICSDAVVCCDANLKCLDAVFGVDEIIVCINTVEPLNGQWVILR